MRRHGGVGASRRGERSRCERGRKAEACASPFGPPPIVRRQCCIGLLQPVFLRTTGIHFDFILSPHPSHVIIYFHNKMILSDLMNNAATAAVVCPIALGVAQRLDSSPDAFLMLMAIGASCAFLTPIGHRNNTLIIGPGGFHFGDCWRLGLPMENLAIAVSIPTLIFFWPL